MESGLFNANFVLATLGSSQSISNPTQSSEKTSIQQHNTLNNPLSEQVDLVRATRSMSSSIASLGSFHRERGKNLEIFELIQLLVSGD